MATDKFPQIKTDPQNQRFLVDYDFIDAFGDEIGPYGIAVYLALARFCQPMHRRELGLHARLSDDNLARTLRTMMDLGLLVELAAGFELATVSGDFMEKS